MSDLPARIQAELTDVRALAAQITVASLRDGTWLMAVLRKTVADYTGAVTAETLAGLHPGLHGDALADARIADAQWRATVAGGTSAGAYASVVMASLATGWFVGAALPAAVTAFAVDLIYLSRLQVCLAWDLALIYEHPLDPTHDDDLWTLTRVAFGVDAPEASTTDLAKPTVPLASRFGTRALTTAARLATGVQAVGRTLALRSLAKFAIPAVGVPLCAGVNHLTTGAVGRAARAIFRDHSRGRQLAAELDQGTDLVICAVLLLLHADKRLERAEVACMAELADLAPADLVAAERRHLSEDVEALGAEVAAGAPELKELVWRAAVAAAELDGVVGPEEDALLDRLAVACSVSRG